MMVRLQLQLLLISFRLSFMFQFHDGTITTQNNYLWRGQSGMFQFHDGTITTIVTLVGAFMLSPFQFHDGTITT